MYSKKFVYPNLNLLYSVFSFILYHYCFIYESISLFAGAAIGFDFVSSNIRRLKYNLSINKWDKRQEKGLVIHSSKRERLYLQCAWTLQVVTHKMKSPWPQETRVKIQYAVQSVLYGAIGNITNALHLFKPCNCIRYTVLHITEWNLKLSLRCEVNRLICSGHHHAIIFTYKTTMCGLNRG